MKFKTQRLKADYYPVKIKDYHGGDLVIRFEGFSVSGKPIASDITLPWWEIPYLVEELNKAWVKERSSRTDAIYRIDTALKGGEK